jgi:hypothetical protein
MGKQWAYLACLFRCVYFGTYSHVLEDIGFKTILNFGQPIIKKKSMLIIQA